MPTLYVTEPGATLRQSGEALVVTVPGATDAERPPRPIALHRLELVALVC